jgi:hypothetical protein
MRTEHTNEILAFELADGEMVERWLEAATICRILSCHVGTLRRWRRTGVLPSSAFLVLGPGEYRYALSRVLVALARR